MLNLLTTSISANYEDLGAKRKAEEVQHDAGSPKRVKLSSTSSPEDTSDPVAAATAMAVAEEPRKTLNIIPFPEKVCALGGDRWSAFVEALLTSRAAAGCD